MPARGVMSQQHHDANALLLHVISHNGEAPETNVVLDIMLGGRGGRSTKRFEAARNHLRTCNDPSHADLALSYRKAGSPLVLVDKRATQSLSPLGQRVGLSYQGLDSRLSQWMAERQRLVDIYERFGDEAVKQGQKKMGKALKALSTDLSSYGHATAATAKLLAAAGIPL